MAMASTWHAAFPLILGKVLARLALPWTIGALVTMLIFHTIIGCLCELPHAGKDVALEAPILPRCYIFDTRNLRHRATLARARQWAGPSDKPTS